MLKFCRTYRWELTLLLGIPFAAWLSAYVIVLAFSTFAIFSIASVGPTRATATTLDTMGGLALLAIAYVRVLKLGRSYLTLIWRAAIANAVIVTSLFLALASADSAEVSLLVFLTGDILSLAIYLWFARQASRFSLAHAFLLVLIFSMPISVGDHDPALYATWPEVPRARLSMIWLLTTFCISFANGVLGAWLLGNFEKRGPAFHRLAVIGLLAWFEALAIAKAVIDSLWWLQELSDLTVLELIALTVGALLPAVTIPCLIALAYLVRVRRTVR